MKRALFAVLGFGLVLGSFSAGAEELPDEMAPMDSLSAESADLAAALLQDRSLEIDEPIAPAERTRLLAKAAGKKPADDAAATEKKKAAANGAPTLTQPIFGFGDEIETDSPETKKAIEKAREESDSSKAPAPVSNHETL